MSFTAAKPLNAGGNAVKLQQIAEGVTLTLPRHMPWDEVVTLVDLTRSPSGTGIAN